ncbi:hypothetical protein GCM10023074_67190 [Microbispora amethystogenes]|uniref:Uncharacterized protein n=1 Tax=Microbispora amethystogenes TaxID=1427754 RepID=A0ABQ4FMM4_9ACTN|nr:hypothetical protein Mam01_62290 [Microbispora amethystogenes]
MPSSSVAGAQRSRAMFMYTPITSGVPGALGGAFGDVGVVGQVGAEGDTDGDGDGRGVVYAMAWPVVGRVSAAAASSPAVIQLAVLVVFRILFTPRQPAGIVCPDRRRGGEQVQPCEGRVRPHAAIIRSLLCKFHSGRGAPRAWAVGARGVHDLGRWFRRGAPHGKKPALAVPRPRASWAETEGPAPPERDRPPVLACAVAPSPGYGRASMTASRQS